MIRVFENLKIFHHEGEWYVGLVPTIVVEGPFSGEDEAWSKLKELKSGASGMADSCGDGAHQTQLLT